MWSLALFSKDLPNSTGPGSAKTSSSSTNVASAGFRWVTALCCCSTDMLAEVFLSSFMACWAVSAASLAVRVPFLADSSRLIQGVLHQLWGSVVWPCCHLHLWQSGNPDRIVASSFGHFVKDVSRIGCFLFMPRHLSLGNKWVGWALLTSGIDALSIQCVLSALCYFNGAGICCSITGTLWVMLCISSCIDLWFSATWS